MRQDGTWTSRCLWIGGTPEFSVRFGADRLVDRRRAVAALRAAELVPIHRFPQPRIAQVQMHGLILLMVGVGEEHRGEPVKGQYAIRLGILDDLAIGCRLQGVVQIRYLLNPPLHRKRFVGQGDSVLDE